MTFSVLSNALFRKEEQGYNPFLQAWVTKGCAIFLKYVNLETIKVYFTIEYRYILMPFSIIILKR